MIHNTLSFFKKNPLVSLLFMASIIFTLYIFFFKLGKAPLDNWDEAWHAEMTKEMIQGHNFITPYWNGDAFFDKLPLHMWLSAFFTLFFGISEIAMRLPSAISGCLLIIFATVYLYRKYGLFPAIVGYSTLILNNIFVWRARSGNFDTLPAFFIFLVFLVLIRKSRLRLPVLGCLFSLIYLTRGAYVFFPMSIALVHEILFRRKEFLKNIKGYLLCVLLFLLVPGIWLWLGYMQNGKTFIDFYVFHSEHDVSVLQIKNFTLDYFRFTYYAVQRYFIYFFIFGLFCLLKKIKNAENFLIFSFSVFLLIILSFAERKNNWYLVPAMPFWSLTIAYAVHVLLKLFKQNIILIGLVGLFTLYLSYKTFFVNIQPILSTTSAIGEATSAKYIKARSAANETIVRLDHLFPTFVFYADRHVFVSPSEANVPNAGYSRDRASIAALVRNHTVRWLAGQSRDVDYFLQQYPQIPFKQIIINQDERILEAL